MINNRVYRLNKATKLGEGLELPAGQELEVVMDVVYMGGYMVQPELQKLILSFILKNPNLFIDTTKNW